MAKKQITPKLRLAVKTLKDLDKLGNLKKALDIVTKLEKLGYQWSDDNQTWFNANQQTTIMIRSDSTIAEELMNAILETINNFEYASLELKNNAILYDAKDKDKKVIDGMKQCYLVFTNLDLENDLDNEELDIDEILDDD